MDRRAFNKLASAAALGTLNRISFAEYPSDAAASADRYLALPLVRRSGPDHKILDRYGIPFVEEMLPLDPGSSARIEIGEAKIKRIFLLGMVHSGLPRGWSDPLDYSGRFFNGDELGRIRLDYVDHPEEVFPLILGESIWWGNPFVQNPSPFPTDPQLRNALAESLRLYPPAPVTDGNYVALITPKPILIRRITIEDSPAKRGVPIIAGITAVVADGNEIGGTVTLQPSAVPAEFTKFVQDKSLRPLGEQLPSPSPLDILSRALYTSDENFHGHVAPEMPNSYVGPKVSFNGSIFAEILTNAFHHNAQDMVGKIDDDGTYHTSTKDAVSWGSYGGFGTFRNNAGPYYGQSYSRDLGRSLQELTALGYTTEATHCADFCLRVARQWEEKPSLQIDGNIIPRHWCRIINRPGIGGCFENDGHGLITVFLYRLWQTLPNRDQWLRQRWPDIKAAGDWILWQFDHPEISGASDVLYTTGESSDNGGNTVYADFVCMIALRALAEMADAAGQHPSAARWRDRAEKMRASIGSRYIVSDPKYGRIWTLESAGWSHKSTVLGPLIFLADSKGLAPEDDDPAWRPVNEAAYQRLTDTYRPFGFYGQAMGYGQGFVTQSALLLDRMQDATQMLDWAARQIYDPRIGSYIVPEGCEVDATGRFWYHMGDLGNGVQEAEIIKALRIVIGVDDVRPDRLRLFPRLPFTWSGITVEKYPLVFTHLGTMQTAFLQYKLERSANQMKLEVASDKELPSILVRLGPFGSPPDASRTRINGTPHQASTERSGDSWWVRLNTPIGPAATVIEVG